MASASSSRKIEVIVTALVDAANDKNEDVQQAISSSLQTLGTKKSDLVLSTCSSYLIKHPKISTRHKITILDTMRIVCDNASDIDENLLKILINQAASEMVSSKEICLEWQTAASGILVSLAKRNCHEVMEILLVNFQPGVVPNFHVVETFAHMAQTNVYNMVPFLKPVLGTLLTVINDMKLDSIKCATAHALSKFSEAVLEYVANIDKAPDPTVKPEMFETEFTATCNVLFTWLNSKETTLRLFALEAIGSCSRLIPKDKFEEQLERVMSSILTLYKRQNGLFVATQSLCLTLETGFRNESTSLNLYIDNLIQVLFPHVCDIPDYSKPESVKIHNEVLRCFYLIVQCYPDHVAQFLTTNLENTNEKNRIGSLNILRHLVNTCSTAIDSKIGPILEQLKIVAKDNNVKVKQVMAPLIVSLAHHGYLQSDVGSVLVEFLIRHSGTSSEDLQCPGSASELSVRTTCENVLHVLTTSVSNTETVEKVLWPHLLEYIVPIHYTGSIGTICKNAASIATKLRYSESELFEIEYAELNTIHKPWALLARLLVLLGSMTNERISILQLMKALGPTFNKNIVATWDAEIPKLINFLNTNEKSDEATEWEDQVLYFLEQTLSDVDEEEWCTSFGRVLIQQNKCYSNNPKGKSFLFKCVGEVLIKVHDEEFVRGSLDAVYSATNHADNVEREGCASAFGRTSVTHVKTALNVLEIINNATTCKKPTGLFSFFMDSKSDEQDTFKPTVVLCFASIFKSAQMVQLVPKIETTLIEHIVPYTRVAKTEEMALTLLRAIDECASALFPVRFGAYFLEHTRNEILSSVQALFLSNDSVEVMEIALKCTTDLLKLHPVGSKDDAEQLLKACLFKVYSFKTDETECASIHKALDQLDYLLKYLLSKDSTPDNLHAIVCALEDWLCSSKVDERKRSIRSMVAILISFSPVLVQSGEKYVHFNPIGGILARLIPRCFDSNRQIQLTAIEGIARTFQISSELDGFSKDYYISVLTQLEDLSNSVFENENILDVIGQIVADNLPLDQIIALLHLIMQGLTDPVVTSAFGVASFMNMIIELRGAGLFPQVEMLMELLHSRLNIIESGNVKSNASLIVQKLATHHLTPVVNYLLSCPTPFTIAAIGSWRILAQDPELGGAILINFLQYITKSEHICQVQDPRNRKKKLYLANQKTISILMALKELFHQVQMEDVAREYFSQLFASLALLCGIFVVAYPPPPPGFNKEKVLWPTLSVIDKIENTYPIRVVTDAFRAFLLCARMEEFLAFVCEQECWINFECDHLYPDSVVCLTRALCEFSPHYLSATVHHLNYALNNQHEPYRVVTVAFFAELISQRCKGDQILLELVMNNLVSKLADSSSLVRKLCIKGLANIECGSNDEILKYSPTVLSAMLVGLDDKDDPNGEIVLESMNGLSKILALIDVSFVESILINIVLRVRPYFENTKQEIRSAAFRLFGDLTRFGDGESQAAFSEQVHNNLVSLLLHLNDPEESVIKACKYALRSVGPIISSEGVNLMFQKHLFDDAILHYGEFMNDLSKIMIKEFPGNIPLYVTTNATHFKSSWPLIHSNALLLVGFLLSNLPTQQQAQIPKDSICTALTLSLKSESTLVRIKAAEAMSLLHEY